MSIRFHNNSSGPYPRPGGYNAAWHQIELADERLARGNFEGAQTAIYQASRILYNIEGGDEDYYMAVTKTVYAMVYIGIYSRFHNWKLNGKYEFLRVECPLLTGALADNSQCRQEVSHRRPGFSFHARK